MTNPISVNLPLFLKIKLGGQTPGFPKLFEGDIFLYLFATAFPQ